jgi:transglutaminase-like putative cysteine protease
MAVSVCGINSRLTYFRNFSALNRSRQRSLRFMSPHFFRALCTTLLLITGFTGFAQSPEISALARRYPGENAVLLNHSEVLTLSPAKGRLTGSSEISRETLLLTERAVNIHNTDELYHGFNHQLRSMEAATLSPSGDRYKTIRTNNFKTTHSSDENIFYNDTKQTRVSYTNLSRFAKTRLSYSLDHNDLHFLLPFYFQSYLPVVHSSFTVSAPRGVQLGYMLKGIGTEKIRFRKEESRNEIRYIWEADSLPAFRSFEKAPSGNSTIPHLVIYIKEYEVGNGPQRLLADADDLYGFYYGFIKNVDSKADAEMSAIVDSLMKGRSDERAKAAAIYRWVQDHMRYVAYEDSLGGFIPRAAAMVCSRRFGDCKDMTSVQVAMARKAGLDAHFAWIGTRDLDYRYTEVPSPVNSNHMICMARIGGKWVYMDGTDRSIPFGFPPAPIQGKEAMISIDEKKYEIVMTPVAEAAMNQTRDTTRVKIVGGGLEGTIASYLSGYDAWNAAGLMQYSSGNDRDKFLKRLIARGGDQFVSKNAQFIPGTDERRSCSIRSEMKLPDYVREAAGESFVNLNLERDFEDLYVDVAQRKVPLDFNYRRELHEVLSLEIPAGQHASYIPADKKDEEPGLWSYSFRYVRQGNRILLLKDIVLNVLQIQPSKFAAHNRLVEGLRNEYRESVVLTRLP